MSKRNNYSNEFKQNAINRALEVGMPKTSEELNIPSSTLRAWVSAYRQSALENVNETRIQTPEIHSDLLNNIQEGMN